MYYRKRSEEILQQTERHSEFGAQPSDRRKTVQTQRDPSHAIHVMFSQEDDDASQIPAKISPVQSKLTGGLLSSRASRLASLPLPALLSPLQSPAKKRNSVLGADSDSSNDSILSPQTPVKRNRLSIPTSPSKGIARVTPRRSSILVSPSKNVHPARFTVQERSQRYAFYVKQVAARRACKE